MGKGKERVKENEPPLLVGLHHPYHHHRHAEGFVKDVITFLWESEPEALHHKALFKVCSPMIWDGMIWEERR
jgi:hypothetical protein